METIRDTFADLYRQKIADEIQKIGCYDIQLRDWDIIFSFKYSTFKLWLVSDITVRFGRLVTDERREHLDWVRDVRSMHRLEEILKKMTR